jgi:hypothetical protein
VGGRTWVARRSALDAYLERYAARPSEKIAAAPKDAIDKDLYALGFERPKLRAVGGRR